MSQAAEASVAERLEAAADSCARQGGRLTELRRLVLELVLEADRPVGAYELLEQLRQRHAGAAPPTVYRALDFLVAYGLVHKLALQNAFVSCSGGGHHAHPAQLLVCRSCGSVAELEDADIRAALVRAATAYGFAVGDGALEVPGLCADCTAGTRDGSPD